jgi:hypothetical protein
MNDLQTYAYEHPFTQAAPLDARHFTIEQESRSRQVRIALSVNK